MFRVQSLGTFFAAALAAAAPLTVVHERRGQVGGHLDKTSLISGDAIIPVRIGLVQRNLEKGYDHLLNVYSPDSPNYGKQWTLEEVNAEFMPSKESANIVLEWLASAGVTDARQTANRGWIAFDAPAHKVESLFETRLYEFEDGRDGTVRIGCDEYALPDRVASVVDYITPGVKLSPPMRRRSVKREGNDRSVAELSRPAIIRHHTDDFTVPDSARHLPAELRNCGSIITPPCLRALYGIPFPTGQLKKGDLGIFEDEDIYAQSDLDSFFEMYANYVPNGTHPTLVSINGGYAPVQDFSSYDTGESDIDFCLAYSLLGDVDITLYQTLEPNENDPDGPPQYAANVTFFDAFLDAIDGSFCDEYEKSQGFQCGGANLTTVISASYETPELFYQPLKSQERVCHEFMKLSLQGHTIVYSSGDYGVAANPDNNVEDGCANNGCFPANLNNTGAAAYNGTIFNAAFPSNCPYVLAVGATMLTSNETVLDQESAMNLPGEESAACNSTATFSSSGGFSNYFKRPSYQDHAIETYFNNHDPSYPHYEVSPVDVTNKKTSIGQNGGIYSRNGRGFPDVSANGANLAMVIADYNTTAAGTSLSTPIWASLIALINSERAQAGKKPVGFVQPVLYQNPQVFHDIINGSNPGCGTDGFSAVPGWDPITGLGTPNYPKLKDLFLSLP